MFGYKLIKTKKVEKLESDVSTLKSCINAFFYLNYEAIDMVEYALANNAKTKTVEEIQEAVKSVEG